MSSSRCNYALIMVGRNFNSTHSIRSYPEFRMVHRDCYRDFTEFFCRHVEDQGSPRGFASAVAAASREAMRLRACSLVDIIAVHRADTFDAQR